MNLAQALRKRNELVEQIKTLEGRLTEALSYTEENESYTQEDFDNMQDVLCERREYLEALKLDIDDGNHQIVNGVCVQQLILQKGELKARLDFVRRLRGVVGTSTPRRGLFYRDDDESPEKKYRLTPKQLDASIDDLVVRIRACDDEIALLNGSVEI